MYIHYQNIPNCCPKFAELLNIVILLLSRSIPWTVIDSNVYKHLVTECFFRSIAVVWAKWSKENSKGEEKQFKVG